ncbi:MAG: MFS transporter, partial [Acetobacteraceae bacterium]|nr:MFS transporter [Acetobacteraceae bacterium]
MRVSETTPPPLTPGERRWSLAAAIGSVTVFGLGIGQGVPLISLLLEQRGTAADVNGLNAGAAFIGVLIGPLLTPTLVRRIGIRDFVLVCLGLDALVFGSMKLFDSLGPWFILRMLLGLIGSSIFTASEAWINLLADDARRGRILGLYAAALAAGFGIGPLALSVTGIDGWSPFLLNIGFTVAAMLPLFGVGNLARRHLRERGASPLRMFARAPFILLTVALFGLYESGLMALLPVWGVRLGLGQSLSADTVSAIYFGSIALQVPIGWLSDHLTRRYALLACGAAGLGGAVLLAAVALPVPALFPLLFVWGGAAGGIYPVALAMAGERFRGGDLVAINASMIIAYGLGAMGGPALGGAAIELFGPRGLPGLFALLFLAFLLGTAAARDRIAGPPPCQDPGAA